MAVDVGAVIALDIEKPVAGGWMLARLDGQVVLVSGAIPGERVRARIERAARSVLHAATAEVLRSSPDRRETAADPACGGHVFAHIAYERQRRLKGDIVRDALERIGRIPLEAAPEVLGSPERGYRLRARLHARDARLGFFREGTHRLCDAARTGQLSDGACAWIAAAERVLTRAGVTGLEGVELAENVAGDERACHLILHAGVEARSCAVLTDAGPLTGLSAERADRPGVEVLAGVPAVTDVLHVRPDDSASTLRLRRDTRAFFQANRYLLEPLVQCVLALVPPGPVVDLYAGVGLFGLSLLVAGAGEVALVEGDPISGESLQENAAPFGTHATVHRRSVESFLQTVSDAGAATFIVDPPRTGLSKVALGALVRARPVRLVYVSCDVATLARDTRAILGAGYVLDDVRAFDLFPNTAHVETVAAFSRGGRASAHR